MNPIRPIALAVLVLLPTTARCQNDFDGFRVALRSGYTRFNLSDQSNIMQSGVDWYNAHGIPVHMQKDFPGNAIVGAEGTYTSGIIRAGGGLYLANTMGFFGYQDNSGTMKTKSTVKAAIIEAVIGLNPVSVGDAQVYIVVKPGYGWGTWDFSHSVSFNQFSSYDQVEAFSGRAAGFTIQYSAGVEYFLTEELFLQGEAGYRSAEIKPVYIQESPTTVGLNLSGFIGTFSIGMIL